MLTAKTVNYGGTVQTDETISFSNQKPGAPVIFVDENAATNGTRYSQPAGAIGPDGTWSGKLTFTDTNSVADTTFTGLLKIGTSSIYYSWNVTAEASLTLAVGKGVIFTLNVEVGDTLTGSATVTEAANPVEVHVWELDGSEAQEGSSATYTTTAAGSVRYENTDDNNQSAVIGAWSDAVTVTEVFDPTKPNATMSGLRFDSGRKLTFKIFDPQLG